MTDLRIYLDGDRVGPLFRRATARKGAEVRNAVRGTAQDAADEIEEQGREDIAGAGNFGSRWTEGFNAKVTEGGGNIRIEVSEDQPYWAVFEYGAVISGNPLLWIPFDDAADAKGIWPRDYSTPLFRIDSKAGLPLLFSWQPGEKTPAKPVYFGKEEVIEPQKFHLRDIIRKVVKQMPQMFKERMAK
jgi:hypothetical protein